MAVERTTAAELVAQIRTALLARTTDYDTAFGPIPDVFMNPLSVVLEDIINNKIRPTSLLVSLINSTEFSDEELDDFVFNEAMTRPEGTQATGTLTFFKRGVTTLPAPGGTIPRGFGVSTAEDNGETVIFVTTESRDYTTGAVVPDPDNELATRLEVQVPAIALVTGTSGIVAAGRLTKLSRPLSTYDGVTNLDATTEGRDRYENDELIELYLLAVKSRQQGVPTGLEFLTRQENTAVEDIHVVYGTDPLITRSEAGAVDAYIRGQITSQETDTFSFIGIGQPMVLEVQPVIPGTISVSNPGSTVEGDDWEIIEDVSGLANSTRSTTAIRWLTTGSIAVPLVGASVIVEYQANQLIRNLQADSEEPDKFVFGRDLLYKQATAVPIFLSATVTGTGDLANLVPTQITNFFATLGIGDDVEGSDIQAEVRKLAGVNNFVITRLVRDSAGSGTADIAISGIEYATIALGDITLVIA